MSTASLAHEQQEPTPLHPDAPSECEHQWRADSNFSPYDGEEGGYQWICAKCAEVRWTDHLSTPPEGALIDTRFPNATVPATPPQPMPLTATERSAFLGMQARQRELVQMFNEEERAIVAEIEARLGLDVGAIGVSHTVNAQTWQVVAMPPLASDAA